MIQVTWPRWPPCPYMVKKNLKNLLLQMRKSYVLIIWHAALGTQALQSLYKWWPWVALNLFYGKVKFGFLGFSIGKSENSGYFRNYCSLWSESWEMQTTNWINECKWAFKVKVISGLWPKVHWWFLKPVFLRNHCAIFNQILYVSFQVHGNENFCKWCWSHDQDGCHAHIW